jgi:hypothetical protein
MLMIPQEFSASKDTSTIELALEEGIALARESYPVVSSEIEEGIHVTPVPGFSYIFLSNFLRLRNISVFYAFASFEEKLYKSGA